MHKAIFGSCRCAHGQTGMALMPLILTVVIAGAMIGAGMHLVGPLTHRMQMVSARQMLDRASRSVIAWSVANRRLPTAAEFVATTGVRDDPWRQMLVYAYDGNLAASASGGLCGRESTGIIANGTTDTAFFILSSGADFCLDSTPGVSGAYSGIAILSTRDVAETVTLTELKNRAGCFDRTAGRLTLLNNELPGGCSTIPYSGDLYVQGGTPPYTWAAISTPTWLTHTPLGTVLHCSGTPPTPGNYTLAVTVTDAAHSVVQRHFNITVTSCTP